MRRDRAHERPYKWVAGSSKSVPARVELRDARIEVLVTASEKIAVKALAKRAKRDVSTWIRDVLQREIATSVAKPEASK